MANGKNKILLIIAVALLAILVIAGIFFKAAPAAPLTFKDIPPGWQVIKNEALGIQALVPQNLEYRGCKQPVGLGVVDGSLSLGALWTPCNKLVGESEFFDDTFSGYQIVALENVRTAQNAEYAFAKSMGENCKITFTDWNKKTFVVSDAKPRVNQWAPRSCGDYTDDPSLVRSFYNNRNKTLIIWRQTPKAFPVGQNEYADAQVQLLPY